MKTRKHVGRIVCAFLAIAWLSDASVGYAVCPGTRDVMQRTVQNCPAAPETTGGCTRITYYRASGEMVSGECGYSETNTECVATGGDAYGFTRTENMICDLFGSACGAVYSSTDVWGLIATSTSVTCNP